MSYIIDYDKLTVENGESNGVKPINDIHQGANDFHLSYKNDDGRLWYQKISMHEAVSITWAKEGQEATADNAYYGMGEGLLL